MPSESAFKWLRNTHIFSGGGSYTQTPSMTADVRSNEQHLLVRATDSGIVDRANLRLGATGTDGLEPAVGVFGADPVARQSITGGDLQAQIDSVVAALEALGLVSDDRA